MFVVDVIVVAALIVAFAIGLSRGFVATIGTIAGLVVGAFVSAWLVPLVGPLVPDAAWRGAATIGATVALVLLGGAVGSAIGRVVRRGVDRVKLSWLDRTLGAAVGTVATALVLLMVGQSVTATGTPVVSSAVASSKVLGWIDDLTPPPMDTALAQLRALVVDEGIPTLGALFEFEQAPTAPPIALDDPELQQAAASVARIGGTAYACGVSLTGSGFVVADDLVVTNAHVVAGVDAPVVELPGRSAAEGRVVYFDPVDDLAVIAVGSLDARALPLTEQLAPGDRAAVQGYPLGGPFTSIGADVLSEGTVPVPDIYDDSSTPRAVYALAADVQPGNSGGPLLTADGEVAGVVFARGADGEGRGYAMTVAELAPALGAASAQGPTVSTGRCTG
ncbi:MarP family serine protease [Microbacterium telephonicum]|uniref:Colicin V production protein n=1 Tax=Microbacterium telephonicum TaxID=1714841 RepID=A0A498C9S7_9MICO|nr:MarP family serine protease [Microbacterium telephonicum]RLK49061.1 colicin V production protein [Microbacterium telephonicum]